MEEDDKLVDRQSGFCWLRACCRDIQELQGEGGVRGEAGGSQGGNSNSKVEEKVMIALIFKCPCLSGRAEDP